MIKQKNIPKSNNTQNIFFIAIIGILLILVAYFFGKSQMPRVRDNSQPSSVILDTPIPTKFPSPAPTRNTFNTESCIDYARSIDRNCLGSCTNQADTAISSCPTNDVNQHQNCLNQISALSIGCMTSCTSTAKIAINNCKLGISP